MQYLALATDYDETAAHDGKVDDATLEAAAAGAEFRPAVAAGHWPRVGRLDRRVSALSDF